MQARPMHTLYFSLLTCSDNTRIFLHTVLLHVRDFFFQKLVHHDELHMHADEIREYLCVYRRLSSARDSSIEILPYILNITHNDLCSIDFERILEKCICCCIFFVIFGERLDKRLLYTSPE